MLNLVHGVTVINQGWVPKSLVYQAEEYNVMLKITKFFKEMYILKRFRSCVEHDKEKMRLGCRSEAATVI